MTISTAADNSVTQPDFHIFDQLIKLTNWNRNVVLVNIAIL